MKKVALALSTLFIFSQNLLACDIHGSTGFLPKNNLKIYANEKSSGLSEIQFNAIMDKVNRLFSSSVTSLGFKFIIDRQWTAPDVNAHADQNTPGIYKITMYGGLARHPLMTEDAMALVACHEIGHHLGGAPRSLVDTWASNEGQADYWGAMKCLRRYFEEDRNNEVVKKLNIPSIVAQNCQSIYKNTEEIFVCERIAMAGLTMGTILSSLQQERIVNFTTPDKSIVKRTYDGHPASQCRLDTYFQASLCDHDFSQVVSNSDPNINVCSLTNGDHLGLRPTCWYKP